MATGTPEGIFVRLTDGGHASVGGPSLPWEEGDLVVIDIEADSVIECPSYAVDEAICKVLAIDGGDVYVSWNLSQRRMFCPSELEVSIGDSVHVQNGWKIGGLAPEGASRTPLDRPSVKDRLPELRRPASEIPADARRFAGYEDAVFEARRIFKQAFSEHDILDKLGLPRPRGLLLLGPPGTGKTTLARKLAHEEDAVLYVIRGPEILSPWVGESEQLLQAVFADAERQDKAIIFVDEIDSISMSRGRHRGTHNQQLVAQFLALMDGFEAQGRRLIVGTTNRADDIDEAFRRPGRFDMELTLGETTHEDRRQILSSVLGEHVPADFPMDMYLDQTVGWTGADIMAAVREAASLARDDSREALWASDLLAGLHLQQGKVAVRGRRRSVEASA